MKNKVLELHEIEDRSVKLNVLGQPIDECSCEPMTGWLRDGSCNTDDLDFGHQVVCCVVDEEFLAFSKEAGNDLSTPHPDMGFPGLKPGDHWCLCALRWKEAFEQGKAPKVVLESTHRSALTVLTLEELKQFSYNH